MAQFNYLGTWDDSWTILAAVLARGDIRIIPDRWYETEFPSTYNLLNNELKSIVEHKRRIYLFSSAFSILPPFLVRQNRGLMTGKYSVQEEYAGPLLSLTLPACYNEGGYVNLNFGELSYPSRIIDPRTLKVEIPSQAVLAAYNDIRIRLKRVLHRHKLPKNWIQIGPDALRLLRKGDARIVSQ